MLKSFRSQYHGLKAYNEDYGTEVDFNIDSRGSIKKSLKD
jgi:hypothetical protein